MPAENRSSLLRPTGIAPSSLPRTGTVYEEVAELIRRAGWARGTGRDRHGGYSLREAIDTVVAGRASGAAERIGRAARCCNHLRELAGTTNLDAWNDARDRDVGEIVDLLLAASHWHPED